MRITRVYAPAPLATGRSVALTPSGATHLAKVLRVRVGDAVNIFDGAGNEFGAIIETLGKSVGVRVGERASGAAESPLNITLIQGISRGERMDWVVQKATELGVSTIVPVITARSVVKIDRQQAAKKHEHWRQIMIGACEQCGRNVLPALAQPLTLSQQLSAPANAARRYLLDPLGLQSFSGQSTAQSVELLIGPEGGLDDAEIAAAKLAGFVGVKMGPRVLRTETAAVAALTLLQGMWGDLA